MLLITEEIEDIRYVIEEGATPAKKNYYIDGVFLQSNIVNRNGRKYPKQVMSKELKRYDEQYIQKNRAYGELGHPSSPTINLDRVSHMIKELKEDGDNWIGRAKIMTETPYGAIVKALIDEGATLGVSSRALGSLRQVNGINEVQGDFQLSTAADIVADPSAPDAFVAGIMEGKEWVFENGIWKEKELMEAKKLIVKAPRKDLAEVQLRVFNKLLNNIK